MKSKCFGMDDGKGEVLIEWKAIVLILMITSKFNDKPQQFE